MRKRIISVFIIGILACCTYGCAQTVENTIVVEETETLNKDMPERITVEADTSQHDSVDMVYGNTLFTDENGDELCKLSDFEDMDYYILCDTALAYGPSDYVYTYGIYGETTDGWEEGEQLYQKFKTDFFNENEMEADPETDEIVYISPDGQWVITQRYLGLDEWKEFYWLNKSVIDG